MMENEKRPRILCVDDEPNVLQGLELHLHRRYEVATAVGGAAGLREVEKNGPPAVILSDMRMPEMDGAAFLSRVRQLAPDAVRILLTGQADLDSCIAAVNHGQIFRFLTKPCPPDILLETVKAAVDQNRLITGERVLLEQTLRGSIKTLIDVLSLANPLAFGRASRIKESARELAETVNGGPSWQIEIAAMVSQLGCVSLPGAVVEKLYYGKPLNSEEQEMADQLPAVAEKLLDNIPRLEDVRTILLFSSKHFNGCGRPVSGLLGEAIPFGSRVLKIAIDYDILEAQGLSSTVALDTMRGRNGVYDPKLLDRFAALRGNGAPKAEVKEMPMRFVKIGMVFVEDVRTPGGALLIARGYEVTKGLFERIRNFPNDVKRQEVRVITRAIPDKLTASRF
jgi:response regulator RpfG family c-di-GMP phosphodiesterase